MLAIFQHLTKVGCRLLSDSTEKSFESEISVAVSNESDELLNGTSTSLPSPLVEASSASGDSNEVGVSF